MKYKHDIEQEVNYMQDFTIGFIGGGALAGALLKGIAGKLVPADNIYVSEFRQERCDELNSGFTLLLRQMAFLTRWIWY